MSTFTSFTSASTQSPTRTAQDPFANRYGKSLPRGLRAEASGMSWSSFLVTYTPQNGPIRLGDWSTSDVGRGCSAYEATLLLGGSIRTATATATGVISAMTAMLHDAGLQLEILSFHQHRIGHATATFLLCECAGTRRWAMGFGDSGTESSLRALIAGANRLYGDLFVGR